jgi:hypothetical protein
LACGHGLFDYQQSAVYPSQNLFWEVLVEKLALFLAGRRPLIVPSMAFTAEFERPYINPARPRFVLVSVRQYDSAVIGSACYATLALCHAFQVRAFETHNALAQTS